MSFSSPMEEAQLRFEQRAAQRRVPSRSRTRAIPSFAAKTLAAAGLYRLAGTVDSHPARSRG
jgi:hypothetical protein